MKPSYADDWTTLYTTDALSGAAFLEPQSVNCIVTSPPYWSLRSYLPSDHQDKALELGAEADPESYVENLVAIFRALRPALHDTGTLWLNLGDSYSSGTTGRNDEGEADIGRRANTYGTGRPKALAKGVSGVARKPPPDYKPKDLIGLPWMVAFALRADGWYLRSDCIWSKPNPMPESVQDRPTRSHEYLFLLAKRPKYYFDGDAVREKNSSPKQHEHNQKYAKSYARFDERVRETGQPGNVNSAGIHARPGGEGRNIRSVLTIPTKPYRGSARGSARGSHYAVMPLDLVYPCIRAGSSEYGVCGACKAPHERVVEISGETTQERARHNGHADHAGAYGGASQSLDFKGSHWKLPPRERRSVGWQSTCSCDSEIESATVLDPFMGSGTTALAARKLGRRSVGFDLGARNIALVEERLIQGVLL